MRCAEHLSHDYLSLNSRQYSSNCIKNMRTCMCVCERERTYMSDNEHVSVPVQLHAYETTNVHQYTHSWRTKKNQRVRKQLAGRRRVCDRLLASH